MPSILDFETATPIATQVVYVVDPAGPTDQKMTVESLLESSAGDNEAYLRTDGTRALGGTWDVDNNFITNVPTPTLSHHPANKAYVDATAAGLEVQPCVRVATTTAGTLASDFENGDTVDGVVLATGDRILIKDQASGIENGPYTVNASGAPTRASEATTGTSVFKYYWAVEEGTENTGTGWTVTNASGSDVIDTDSINFEVFIKPPGGAAPATAAYVTMAAHGTLTKERILITSEGVTHTDAGANNNVTLKLNVNGLTEDTSPDSSADFLVTYDTSAGAHKKVLPNNLGLAPPFSDSTALLKDNSDDTKKLIFQLSTITAGQTREITAADEDIDLAPGTGSYFASDGDIGDLNNVTITSPVTDQVLRYNAGTWVNSTFDASYIQTGLVEHERGGLEFDASAVAIGDVIAGTATGTMGLVTASGHSDGDVLTIQADGSVDWEAPGAGGEWTDTGTLLHPADLSGAEDVAIGRTTAVYSARLTSQKTGNCLSLWNQTDAASNVVGVFAGNSRTGIDGDEAYIRLELCQDLAGLAEFGRITWSASDTANASKDGGITLSVQVANTLTDTFQIDETGVKTLAGAADFSGSDVVVLPSSAAPTVNADGEIALDTTVPNMSHGVFIGYGGEEQFFITLPIGELSSLADGVVPKYNATDDEFQLDTIAGGGGADFVIHEVMPPASSAATITMVAGGSTPAENVPSYAFDAATDEYLDYLCHVEGYGGGGLTLTLRWTSDTATSGNVIWNAAIRYMADDTDAFGTSHTYDFNSVTAAAPSAAKEMLYDDITFTDGTDMDSLVDGTTFVVRIRRDADNGSDTMAGDALLFGIALKET